MAAPKLTPKQEAFCLAYIETGNASEAYRRAYDASRMKPASVNRLAKALVDHVKIASRLDALRAKAAKRNEITVDDLLAELEEERQAALRSRPTVQSSAAVAATMGKAKLLGMDRVVLDHMSSDRSMSPACGIDPSKLSDAALRELMAAMHGQAGKD